MKLGENADTNQGAPQNAGQSSGGKPGSTSNAAKTYTEEEVKLLTEKVRSDTLAEAGRRSKPVEDENATLKSQLATNQRLIKDTEEKISKLQTQIDEMLEDDPDAERYVKKLRALEQVESQLKADRTALETEKTTHAERIKKAEKAELDETIKGVVSEYDGISQDRLTALCDKLNLTTKEQIVAAAETLGTKKQADQENQTAGHTDSGATNGGGVDISKMSSHEKIIYGLNKTKKK